MYPVQNSRGAKEYTEKSEVGVLPPRDNHYHLYLQLLKQDCFVFCFFFNCEQSSLATLFSGLFGERSYL